MVECCDRGQTEERVRQIKKEFSQKKRNSAMEQVRAFVQGLVYCWYLLLLMSILLIYIHINY